ncbi:hypothetical protein PR202_ga03267 [Eleusine coracana subsp. coracana]|uniref:Uncharacterized protein n=1 Tax=Eleusine coracana subsp. coracana TaxID=191504 RepID=A0AAV5BMZ7_ELECO|nr:hypothetical protein PR202_ga03267 [Eleusine coracana subsp. coracana]
MGWAHAAVSMEEVLGLVRGFVDLLVLAGGRTSSGAAATWSRGEVIKALRWALFFEELFKNLRDSGQYEDSARELDAALAELTSSPDFPKGLADMRSETLSSARTLVIRHFLKTKTTSVENFGALLEAVVEMDIDGFYATGEHNACEEYVKSILDMNLSSLIPTRNACKVGLPSTSDEPHTKSMSSDHSHILVKEFLNGMDSASHTSLAERGLGTLLKSVKKNNSDNARDIPHTQTIPNPKSALFDIYLAEIDRQFREAAPADRFRKCTCRGDGIDQHRNCEIAERIQCLYTFHVQQPLQ